MLLTFGPSGTYFFDDEKGNRKWSVTAAFDQHMATHLATSITSIALGEGGAFFVNRCSNGFLHHNDFLDPENIYPKLKTWIFDAGLGHDRKSVYAFLGQKGRFWAVSNAGYRWRGIPEGLEEYFQRFTSATLFSTKRVHTVDWGCGDAFLGIGIDGTWFWDLKGQYAELDKLLKTKDPNILAFVTLNPFAPHQHFVAFNDGTASWSVPAAWAAGIQTILQQHAVQAQRNTMSLNLGSTAVAAPTINYGGLGLSDPGRYGLTSPHPPAHSLAPPTSYNYSYQQAQSPGWGKQSVNLAQSVLEAYNNSQAQIGSSGGGGSSIVDGVQMVNDLTNNGLMVGQLVGQLGSAGAAAGAACNMM